MRSMTSVRDSPRARAAKVSAMRCWSTGMARRRTSSGEGARRPVSSASARTASISACAARGPGPQATRVAEVRGRGLVARPAGPHEVEDHLDDGLAHRHPPQQRLRLQELARPEHRGRLRVLGPGGGHQDVALGRPRRVGHVDLQEEPVELRLGQGIGALLLDGVLRGEHVERRARAAGARPAMVT